MALRPMERTSFFVEADGLAVMRRQEDDLLAIGEADGDQFVSLLDVDGDDAARHHVGEIFEFGLLHRAVAGGEEDVACLLLPDRAPRAWCARFRRAADATRLPMCLPLPAAPTSGISYTFSQ